MLKSYNTKVHWPKENRLKFNHVRGFNSSYPVLKWWGSFNVHKLQWKTFNHTTLIYFSDAWPPRWPTKKISNAWLDIYVVLCITLHQQKFIIYFHKVFSRLLFMLWITLIWPILFPFALQVCVARLIYLTAPVWIHFCCCCCIVFVYMYLSVPSTRRPHNPASIHHSPPTSHPSRFYCSIRHPRLRPHSHWQQRYSTIPRISTTP